MTKGKYAKFPNVPEGSVIEYSEGRAVAWYPRGERVEVKLPLHPAPQLPWEVLTADDARELACEISVFVEAEALSKLWLADARVLDAYADAVDAMTRKEKGDAN